MKIELQELENEIIDKFDKELEFYKECNIDIGVRMGLNRGKELIMNILIEKLISRVIK